MKTVAFNIPAHKQPSNTASSDSLMNYEYTNAIQNIKDDYFSLSTQENRTTAREEAMAAKQAKAPSTIEEICRLLKIAVPISHYEVLQLEKRLATQNEIPPAIYQPVIKESKASLGYVSPPITIPSRANAHKISPAMIIGGSFSPGSPRKLTTNYLGDLVTHTTPKLRPNV